MLIKPRQEAKPATREVNMTILEMTTYLIMLGIASGLLVAIALA